MTDLNHYCIMAHLSEHDKGNTATITQCPMYSEVNTILGPLVILCVSSQYPFQYISGLSSHSQHSLAKKLLRGFGGMISFYVKGSGEQTKTFLKSLKVCRN